MEQPISFANRIELRQWLENHHSQPESIWILFTKKDKKALQHIEALKEALCFGWIDSQVKNVDETFYKMKFSPRRKNSNWSERNKKLITELISSGSMAKPGLAEIEKAKKNGLWDKCNSSIPRITDDLLKEKLKDFEGMTEKFEKLSPSAKKFFVLYYYDAKREETKVKRLLIIVDHIEKGKRIF